MELSIVKEAVCKPFVYPTPFELHFSIAYLNWYLTNPMYMTLNLCRVLAYKTEKLIVSKREGGEWTMKHIWVPAYQKLISDALKEYKTGEAMETDNVVAQDFAGYMLQQIRGDF